MSAPDETVAPVAAVSDGAATPAVQQEQTVRWIGWMMVVALTGIAIAVLWRAPMLKELDADTRAIVVGIVSSVVACFVQGIGHVLGQKAALAQPSASKLQ